MARSERGWEAAPIRKLPEPPPTALTGPSRDATYQRLRVRALELYRDGGTIKSVAVALGLPRTTVGDWVRSDAPDRRSRRKWSDEDIIACLIRWYETHGTWPSFHGWKLSTAEHPSSTTAHRRFGSWLMAIETARERMLRAA